MGGFAGQIAGLGQESPPFAHGWRKEGYWSSLRGVEFLGWPSAAGAPVNGDGWHTYIGDPSPPRALCQFKQHDDGVPWVGYGKDVSPYFNVAYLKWRYTGIAKQERGL